MIDLSGRKTLIMGILNVTPDSFYDGGRNFDRHKAIDRAFEMFEEGADIIDIGGESTRPGAEPVSENEEIDRVCPVIEALTGKINIPLSVDTYKAGVAREALKLGAAIVNDISAMIFDSRMAEVIAEYNAYAVLMHIKGTPRSMQNNPVYVNLLGEIYEYLQNAVAAAIKSGIQKDKIIIDPGIGFGKSFEDNYKIIKNLSYFAGLNCPILIGLSRKSLIGRLYPADCDRLYATLALNAVCAAAGAAIIRVHDVKAHVLAMQAIDMLKKSQVSD